MSTTADEVGDGARRDPTRPSAVGSGDVVSPVPDVLYVMGMGRSGTTILSLLLANNRGMLGAGEVTYCFRDAFAREEPCSCGREPRACPVWGEVDRAFDWGENDPAELHRRVSSVDHHRAFPRHLAGAVGRAGLREYLGLAETTYAALARGSGVDVVVDSSKYPGRALALANRWGPRLRVLCVTRSPEGVLHSMQKPNEGEQEPSSLLFCMAYYASVMASLRLAVGRLRAQGVGVMELTFEELCDDPVGTLSRIEGWSGCDFSEARSRLESGRAFDVGHIVTGNRLRKAEEVEFQPERGDAEPASVSRRWAARPLAVWRSLLGFS